MYKMFEYMLSLPFVGGEVFSVRSREHENLLKTPLPLLIATIEQFRWLKLDQQFYPDTVLPIGM